VSTGKIKRCHEAENLLLYIAGTYTEGREVPCSLCCQTLNGDISHSIDRSSHGSRFMPLKAPCSYSYLCTDVMWRVLIKMALLLLLLLLRRPLSSWWMDALPLTVWLHSRNGMWPAPSVNLTNLQLMYKPTLLICKQVILGSIIGWDIEYTD
jgi:hypothetical protein